VPLLRTLFLYPFSAFSYQPVSEGAYCARWSEEANRSAKRGSAKLQCALDINSRNLGFMCLKWVPKRILKVEWRWN